MNSLLRGSVPLVLLALVLAVGGRSPAEAQPLLFDHPASVVAPQDVSMAAAMKITITAASQGKRSQFPVDSSSASLASSVYSLARQAFAQCDSMLRMIVDDQRLSQVKGNSYVEISFQPAAQLNVAYGGGKMLKVSKLVVPLSATQTAPEWTFYALGDTGNWLALRWTKPDPALLKSLRQSSRRLLGLQP